MASPVAPLHRFTVDDIIAMVEAGILDERDRVELVDGALVEMSPPGPLHASVVEGLNRHFVKASGGEFRVRVQDTFLTAGDGFVQPDLMLIEPIARDRLPDTALLVIEVSYSSRARDIEKAAGYATAGVREYWIVDLDREEVLVHRSPRGIAYTSIERLGPGDVLTALVAAPPVDVAALLAR